MRTAQSKRALYPCDSEVQAAMDRLIEHLRAQGIPPVLLSQYMPMQYARVQNEGLQNEPAALIRDHIGDCLFAMDA